MPTFTLSLDTSKTSDDSQLSALALSCNQYEWNDVIDNNFDYFDDSVNQAFKDLDHESIYIEHLNQNGMPVVPIHENCPLLPGACFALHTPKDHLFDSFQSHLDHYVEARRKELHECLGDYSHMPQAYSIPLQDAYDYSYKYTFNEYLNGDRSHDGILGLAQEYFFGCGYPSARFDYDRATDKVSLTIDDDDLEAWNDLAAWKEPENGGRTIEEYINECKFDNVAKREVDRAKRTEEYLKQKAHRAQQEEQKQQARRAKLEAMVK